MRRQPGPTFWKKSFPLSSTRMNAGKSTTSIFQMASMPEFRELDHFDLANVLLGENRCRAANAPQVEAAVLLAGVGHLRAAIAFGDHHQAAALALEQFDVRVHAAGGRGAERTAGQIGRLLGRTRVIDRMGLEIVRQRLAGVESFLELGMRDVACDDDRA